MTRDELLNMHVNLCNESRKLMELKNADYGAPTDPLKNLRLHGSYGVSVRLHDKVCRLESASQRGLKVADETAEDTVLDVIAYAVLWLALRREETK